MTSHRTVSRRCVRCTVVATGSRRRARRRERDPPAARGPPGPTAARRPPGRAPRRRRRDAPSMSSPYCWETQAATAGPRGHGGARRSTAPAPRPGREPARRPGYATPAAPVSGSRPTIPDAPWLVLRAPDDRGRPPGRRTGSPARARGRARQITPMYASTGGTTPGIAASAATRASLAAVEGDLGDDEPRHEDRRPTGRATGRAAAATSVPPGRRPGGAPGSSSSSTTRPGAGCGPERDRRVDRASTSSTSRIRPAMRRTVRLGLSAADDRPTSRRASGATAGRRGPRAWRRGSSGSSTRNRATVAPCPTLIVTSSSRRASNACSSVTSSPA